MRGRVHRLAETGRASLSFWLDGQKLSALEGDTVLTAILSARPALRASEFGPEQRAGFCLMGACQDCWIWQENGPRIRACSTQIEPGMQLRVSAPDGWLQ